MNLARPDGQIDPAQDLLVFFLKFHVQVLDVQHDFLHRP